VSRRASERCPLLLPDDILGLAVGLTLQADHLLDVAVGARHSLSQSGEAILRCIADGCRFDTLQAEATILGIKAADLYSLLDFLNAIGGLQRKRSPRNQLRALGLTLRTACMGVHWSPLHRRRIFSPLGVLWASLIATLPVIGACLLLAVVCAGANLAPLGNALIFALGSCIIFVCSITLHEAGHAIAAWKYGAQATIIWSLGNIALLHRRLSPGAESIVSLTGPAAGALLSLAGGILGAHLAWHSLACVCLGITLLHILCLWPGYGDGQAVASALRTKHKGDT